MVTVIKSNVLEKSLKKRIPFQYYFQPIKREDLEPKTILKSSLLSWSEQLNGNLPASLFIAILVSEQVTKERYKSAAQVILEFQIFPLKVYGQVFSTLFQSLDLYYYF